MTEPIDTWTVAINADTSGLQDGLKAATSYGKQFNSALVTAFTGVAAQGKGLTSVFDSLALSVSKIALKAAFQPLTQAAGGLFSNALAGPVGAAGLAFANGGVLS